MNLIVEGDISDADLRSAGFEANTRVGRWTTVRCPLSRIGTLESLPRIRKLHALGRCRPLLDQSAIDVRADRVRQPAPPNFSGRTGAGVLVGIVDSGVDLLHGDFRHPDGTTRIVSAWDQTTDGRHPLHFTYGAEWTAADIDAHNATLKDYAGHGTHALGIAAGDGSRTGHDQPAYRFVGMAPEADLCVVKTDLQIPSIVDAVSYVFEVAAARHQSAVVNLSFGTQDGPHDGTYPLDQMIDGLSGPGRIVVAAAGNEGADRVHAAADVGLHGPQSLTLDVPAYTPAGGTENDYVLLSGWYDGGDSLGIEIITPGGRHVGPVAPGDSLVDQDTPEGYLNIFNGTTSPSNGDREIYVEIFDNVASRPPAPGAWQVRLTPIMAQGAGHADVYIADHVLGDGSVIPKWSQGVVFGGVVGSPGDADSAICVGAYTTKPCWDAVDGHTYCFSPAPGRSVIAAFSSQGPRRDGVQKPDLCAPGYGVVSSKSADAFFVDADLSPDGGHVIQAGTSFSAPHVTGAAALLLSEGRWSLAGPSAIRSQLTRTSRADAYTGPIPNATWGYGKLDVAAAMGAGASVTFLRPSGHFEATTGAPDSIVVMVQGSTADSVVLAYSRDRGIHYDQRIGVIPSPANGVPQSLRFVPSEAMRTYGGQFRAMAFDAFQGNSFAYSDSIFLVQPAIRFIVRAVTPSPFRESTTIRLELERGGSVSVRVFNVSGSLVRTLYSGPMSAGRHDVSWNGRNEQGMTAASGIYFCQVQSSSGTATRRLVLAR